MRQTFRKAMNKHPALLIPLLLAGAIEASAAKVEYNRDVRPILSDKCFKCHGFDANTRKGGLRLDVREEALKPAKSDAIPIVPGKPEASELIHRIASTDADEVMPPGKDHEPLKPHEIALLRQWISEGAEYQPHWAFTRIVQPPLPESEGQNPKPESASNPIDLFVRQKLAGHGLQPAPEADPATLARRAALTLTGLPPAPEEVAAFKQSAIHNPQSAIETLVDRLLASPHFGERMALDWLDAARYADTNGYYTDAERQAWPWRDWVIQAFNDNMPFDRFTIEQLAGDLLPHPATAQRIATAFNRNHTVTNETGIIEEEYRLGYVSDRVDTTSAVWLGLTMGCARCHDHKYDPLSQRDYYRVFAAFNNVDEKGIIKEVEPSSPAPSVMLPTDEQERRLARLAAERAQREKQLKTVRPALAKEIEAWEQTALEKLAPMPGEGSLVHFNFDADNANHGPLRVKSNITGELVSGPGVKGNATLLDSTQYIDFAEPQPMERGRAFTLSVWIQPGGAPQGCVASKQDSDAEGRGFEILWYKSQPRINLAHHYGSDGIEVVAKEKFGGGRWRHLAITYDGSSKAAGLKVYVDGCLSEVDVRRDNLSGSIASKEPWRIGWKGTGIGFDGGMDEFRLFDRAIPAEEVSALHWREFLEGTLAVAGSQRAKPAMEKLEAYYIAHHGSPEMVALSEQIAALRAEEETARKAILTLSVMRELEEPRATHVLLRGQYDQPGEEVTFGVPAVFGELPANAPKNRLGFAQWLVSKENPLTARVAVNRLWTQCFGEGLVGTPDDFGLQGEAPTHPELLDWLAVRFRDGDAQVKPWDVKALLKLIVTSATFRQSSHFTAELLERDPGNRLLARGPRFRLPAELIRDQALAIGGLLVPKIGGPSVKPYQPPGLWEAVSYNGEASYRPGNGESLYRRGLYTFWKRQAPPPDMLTFDGPTREVCTVRRARTNTPLQALLLLNDVNYIEAARGLATQMMRAEADRLAHGFRIATGRAPKTAEVAELKKYFDTQLAEFRRNPDAAKKLLKNGASPADATLDPGELAAWTLTASLLLNLDEVQTQH